MGAALFVYHYPGPRHCCIPVCWSHHGCSVHVRVVLLWVHEWVVVVWVPAHVLELLHRSWLLSRIRVLKVHQTVHRPDCGVTVISTPIRFGLRAHSAHSTRCKVAILTLVSGALPILSPISPPPATTFVTSCDRSTAHQRQCSHWSWFGAHSAGASRCIVVIPAVFLRALPITEPETPAVPATTATTATTTTMVVGVSRMHRKRVWV